MLKFVLRLHILAVVSQWFSQKLSFRFVRIFSLKFHVHHCNLFISKMNPRRQQWSEVWASGASTLCILGTFDSFQKLSKIGKVGNASNDLKLTSTLKKSKLP